MEPHADGSATRIEKLTFHKTSGAPEGKVEAIARRALERAIESTCGESASMFLPETQGPQIVAVYRYGFASAHIDLLEEGFVGTHLLNTPLAAAMASGHSVTVTRTAQLPVYPGQDAILGLVGLKFVTFVPARSVQDWPLVLAIGARSEHVIGYETIDRMQQIVDAAAVEIKPRIEPAESRTP